MSILSLPPRHVRVRAVTPTACMILVCGRTENLHNVWHGLDVPATACDFHTRYFPADVAAAHDALLAEEAARIANVARTLGATVIDRHPNR